MSDSDYHYYALIDSVNQRIRNRVVPNFKIFSADLCGPPQAFATWPAGRDCAFAAQPNPTTPNRNRTKPAPSMTQKAFGRNRTNVRIATIIIDRPIHE